MCVWGGLGVGNPLPLTSSQQETADTLETLGEDLRAGGVEVHDLLNVSGGFTLLKT